MGSVEKLVITDKAASFQDYIKRTPEEALKIRPASDWAAELDDILDNPMTTTGDCLPWGKSHSRVRLRHSELSIWAGVNGHGKSSLNGQVLAWLACSGKKVMVASMEMPPAVTLSRMVRQVVGGSTPDKQWRNQFLAAMEGKLWFYDQLGSVDSRRIIDVTRYSADVLGCDHIQIDSITKVKGLRDDYSKQADLVNDLQSIAFDYKSHIHLIAHMRKSETENKMPDKFDLRGASDIADQADNIFIVWQNKPKLLDRDNYANEPDTVLRVAKQRHGDFEGRINLWFGNQGTYQFVEREGQQLFAPNFTNKIK
jgi:twinkle protein